MKLKSVLYKSVERYRAGKQASEQKYKKIVDMVIDWLDSNIDDAMNVHDPLASDSADLKEKIELALDSSTTKRQIEDGDL